VNARNKQELQIVEAFSAISVPEKIMQESKIKELVQAMLGEQEKVGNDADELERLRREKSDGNFFGNWWNDRDDKLQEAQLTLSTSIGRLTQTSSRLLVVNTAISKVLSDQQNILLQQQKVLEQQARELKGQNEKIFDQQQQLAEQQVKINAANQGLMEAKGVTQEQAEKLVGCVVRVSEAERKIDLANDLLRTTMQAELRDALAQCAARVDEGFMQLDQARLVSERGLEDLLARRMRESQEVLAGFEVRLKTELGAGLGEMLAPVEQKIAAQRAELGQQQAAVERELQQARQELIQRIESVQAAQAAGAKKTGLIVSLAAGASLLSICWQIAGHFLAG